MAAIDIDALRVELTTDPAALGYAGKTAIECKRLLRDARVSVQVPAPIESIEAICMTTVVTSAQVNPQGLPVWWVFKKAAATDVKAELAFDLFGSSQKLVPLVGFWRTKVFSDLRDAGYLNAATFNAIMALGTVEKPRGEALFGRLPTEIEINLARVQ